jgi:two-component system, OmpR family, phosphate regulon sensor histidine kinase PhoR
MWRKKLTWQLILGSLGVVLLPLIVASWYTSTLYRNFYFEHLVSAGKASTCLIGENLKPLLAAGDFAKIDSLCKLLSRDIKMRVTVILPSGKVIGDSEKDPSLMENHRYRPEIMDALAGRLGTSRRLSTTLNEPMMYVASPVMIDGSIVGVVRTAVPLFSVVAALNTYYGRIALVALLMALLAFCLSYLLARRIIGPIRDIKEGAERFARGELSSKIAVPTIDELRHLAVALNEMAQQLHGRIQTITRQRNEQEAILGSMSEGVVAIDSSDRIFSVNASAAALFGIDRAGAQGKLFGECIRNSTIQRFAKKALESGQTIESDITLSSPAEDRGHDRFLQVHGTVLRDAENASIGVLLVASDVTRLRALENIRKDFVANVSHELRTPLTAIKGFVETLSAGALDSKEEALRFLAIIAGQVDRLSSLIDDLLTLAVIEREEESASLVFEECKLIDIVNAAIHDYEAPAAAKQIRVSASVDPAITARINIPLFEQAVGNLIDNAIKYSESGRSIEVIVSQRENNEIAIAISDHGIGIASEHISRIFERFYRVDKARSRKLGGTGLGLSIVKHITALHGGRTMVESVPGKGSTFCIVIPRTGGKS